VLRGDEELKLLAVLEPAGFPVQNFARFLGHKVTVEGRLSAGEPPVMRVRRIRTISEICAPAGESEPPAAVAAQGRPTSLTGCLDEEPGPRYVLRDEKELKLIAALEPDGFPVQNFARYLGNRVRVTGQVAEKEGSSTMKVRKIERISEVCAPEEQ
jgi:hypothetical protein